MNTRLDWNKIFMDFAETLAQRSSCIKYKTAAILVKGTQIKALGYNGTFSGSLECVDKWYYEYKQLENNGLVLMSFNDWIQTEDFRLKHRNWSICNEIHAEINALNWISKKDIKDMVLYTLLSPCDVCAKEIISYGIKKIKYRYLYKNGYYALERLKKYGVEIEQV